MGRFKKGKLQVRRNLWEMLGGTDEIANKLIEANILNRNTESTSTIWSELAIALFQKDSLKNRHWVFFNWSQNRSGIQDRVKQVTGEPHTPERHEQMESEYAGTEEADQTTDSSVHLSEESNSESESMILDADIEFNSEHTHNESDTNIDTHSPITKKTEQQGERSVPDSPSTTEEKPGDTIWRECPKVKRCFTITISGTIWNSIKPQNGESKLRQRWTDHVYESFKEQNPCCTLSFKYQHVKTPLSRKKNAPYLRLKGNCTFSSCQAQYTFSMTNQPSAKVQHVKILVQRTGEIKHKLSEKKARPVVNTKRGKIARALFQGPSNYYYNAIQSSPNKQLQAGNMSDCVSKSVLKVISSEMRKMQSLHSDVLMELYLMQTIMKECDTSYLRLPGYIQLYSSEPFTAHMYTERAIGILVHHLQSSSHVSLYLDATGGVVTKIPDQQKCVLYYAMVLPGKDGKIQPLPVCEMLSNDHSVPPISFWLMKFLYHLSQFSQIRIHQIETDYSWALIQSVLLAFNKEHINCYLHRAFEFGMGHISWEDMKRYTVLHICSAHILKAVRLRICKQTEDKGLRDFATFVFSRLQNATSLTEARTVFRPFCVVLTTPRKTNLVKESLSVLESVILKTKVEDADMEAKPWEKFEIEDPTTIIGSSPFYAFFKQILQEVKDEAAADDASDDNPYFCPGILTILFDTYLAIFPLWSGLVLVGLSSSKRQGKKPEDPPKTRDTNCHIEGWFGIVKHSLFQKEKKMKAGRFIRKMYQSVQGRYLEHIIHHDLPQMLLLQQQPMNFDQCQETWKRGGSPRLKKSKYYPVPKKIPVPLKKREKSQRKKKTKPGTCQLPETPQVQDEVDSLWKKQPTELLVAIVKCPTQKVEYLLHHQELQTLMPHEWLRGETIECYFRAVLNMKGANLYQLSHYITGIILNGPEDQMTRQVLPDVQFEQYDGIISFVNVNEAHWRFVFLHAESQTVFLLDPDQKFNEMEEAQKTCQKFEEYFQMRRETHGKADWVNTKWKPGTIEHSFQEDDFSCGVFVMQMAKQVVEEFPNVPKKINITGCRETMCQYRKNAAKEILSASVSKEEYCSVCGNKNTPENQDLCFWIQCEECERWFHISCLHIKLPPEQELWLCELCV